MPAFASLISERIYELSTALVVDKMHLHPVESGKLLENLYAVKTGTVNFFIYQDGPQLLCFDSGFGRQIILRELSRLGLDPRSVTHLFLTHSDVDHAGGLDLFANAEVYLSAAEQPLVSGRQARMLGLFYNSRLRRPFHLLNDNDQLLAGATRVRAIATPGHTPGSLSYLLNENLLFIGDAFKLTEGRVYPKRAYITMDMQQQENSIRKLAALENIRLACTAHNGCTTEFESAMQSWR